MGYRTYIAEISKEEHNRIKDFTEQQLYEDNGETPDGYVSIRAIHNDSDLYEFGKYTDFDMKKYGKEFFTKKACQDLFKVDYDFYIVGKDFLESVIDEYHSRVKNYYLDMLNPFFQEENRVRLEFLEDVERGHDEDYKDTYKFDFTKITDKQQTSLYKIIEHTISMGGEWGAKSWNDSKPFILDKGDEVTNSWKYEYVIFELVRIYKTFDFDNKLLLFCGS